MNQEQTKIQTLRKELKIQTLRKEFSDLIIRERDYKKIDDFLNNTSAVGIKDHTKKAIINELLKTFKIYTFYCTQNK